MASYSTTAPETRAPLHAGLIPLGAGLLMAALATDVLYLKTVSTQWETFSVWLITAGLLVALVAAVALLVDLAVRTTRRVSWLKLGLLAAAVVLSVINAFVHSRDGYTAVVPTGLTLSAIVTVLLVAAAWGGWSLGDGALEDRR